VKPFGRCPVDGLVSYWDDFGQPRYVAGYHPHAGNDIMAPKGRVIRAPFAGWAVAHSGGTRGGNWVTVVGTKGYVQNDHLSAFGHLGWVKFGTIIGYVGMTGDAVVTHDHFEWHPWVLPKPLHKAPSGFSITTDAIDPFPFLNKVCNR
jgi:murein DD-endopeptidase MepM/ murein hydrolase activator NlpD